MGFFGNLFKSTSTTDLKEKISNGGLLLDVRSKGEFAGGHAPGSKNIPLDELSGKLSKLDKTKPIVAVCASGMRSGTAVNILKNNGFAEVYNGGSWTKYM
jgi:rhodanese-related sulfurtransferase